MPGEIIEVSVLFADVSGSTRIYEAAGDQVALGAIEQCLHSLRECSQACGGTVIKTIGDEIMVSFPSADAAVNAAMRIQTVVAALPPVAGQPLGVRVGFHHGNVVSRDNDLFGDTVNLAARLTELAARDQIITSRATVDQMSAELHQKCRPLYEITVKGKTAQVEICEVLWQQNQEGDATVLGIPTLRRAPVHRLRLRYHGADVPFEDSRQSLTLGRDRSAELVIEDRMASRSHGRIERRMDKFVIVDHSANGTFVTIDGDREIRLQREEMILRGRGWIALGQSRSTTDELLEFSFE